MNTQILKEDFTDTRSRHREPAGVIISKLATLFGLFSILASLIMLVGH